MLFRMLHYHRIINAEFQSDHIEWLIFNYMKSTMNWSCSSINRNKWNVRRGNHKSRQHLLRNRNQLGTSCSCRCSTRRISMAFFLNALASWVSVTCTCTINTISHTECSWSLATSTRIRITYTFVWFPLLFTFLKQQYILILNWTTINFSALSPLLLWQFLLLFDLHRQRLHSHSSDC